MAIATTNPANGELLKSFESLTQEQIEHKLQLAASAFQSHRRTSFAERARMMLRAADILEKEKDECARLMTLESQAQLHSLSAARTNPRRDAVELSVLAGFSLCCTSTHGRQCRTS